MKLYYDRETTPLKFHKFYRFFYLPYELYLGVSAIIHIISSIEYFHLSYVITLCYNLSVLVCIIISLVGIGSWKPYAWKAMITYRIILLIFSALLLLFFFFFFPSLIAEPAKTFLIDLVSSGPILIYYLKRRYLFLPHDTDHAPRCKSHTCPACGACFVSEKPFCPSCGASVD